MGLSLTEIAEQLKNNDKKVQLIYAFNGVGKTRLSREFKELVNPKHSEEEDNSPIKFLYYNAFTEDLFVWDNDLDGDENRKIIIQPNNFTNLAFGFLKDQGQDGNIANHFKHYTHSSITPKINDDFSEVTFSILRGGDDSINNIKISKGEESNFVWCIFYSLIEQIVEVLNIADANDRSTNDFDHLEYIFIDDPVTSLDENHLIELAVDLAQLIKNSDGVKFIITTHNPLFYNVLYNEFKKSKKYLITKLENGSYQLRDQNESPFAYHLFLLQEIENAIETGKVKKYHFNFIRNILEKTAVFLGYVNWGDLLINEGEKNNPYETRLINIASHSKYSSEEMDELSDDNKRMLEHLMKKIKETYHFKIKTKEITKMTEYKTIAESPNYIVLDKYVKPLMVCENGYQSEFDLERELVDDLKNLGYEYLPDVKNSAALLSNARTQIEELNNVHFLDSEWERYVQTYLDKPGDTMDDKARKIHDDYICDFVFGDGHIQNIYLIDREKLLRNKVQVIRQFEQTGTHQNRYDVTILVNGIPMVQVELKKRGVAIREAFNQVHRYSKESFNSEHSFYKYLQVFVISNGTDTRYFANTTKRNKNSFDFTMNWAKSDNSLIKDLKDFTQTFFQKNALLNILFTYSVFDTSNTLLVMRPYQIAATERLLWKIKSSYQSKKWSCTEGGGYIWHTTGSGKTLTSFKAAQLATKLDFIDKVLFVVDRKDLDYQTMKEYQRFSPDSVNGSESTAGLKRNIEKDDNKIIVTTIQKLNNLMKSEDSLAIYHKQVVFIFDECHRSQFGEAQKNLKKKFKFYYQFGFTGTPIFPENALGAETTASVFGRQLHSYIITDAIRDEKVLKFKVDYNDVRPKFKSIESEQDEEKLSAAENKAALLHPDRIKEITQYVLDKFNQKTHRNAGSKNGFNAMFAVSSVESAKIYYQMFKDLQAGLEKQLKVATIFSFAANEEQNAIGEIQDESFETSAMDSSSKEFLDSAIDDYNKMFATNFSTEGKSFQNYYRDLSLRVKNQEIDLLIVVGMFLTGFDAPRLNTLFVDKNLRYHGLIQAYSRTNRIFDSTKTFGNIVTFRDLEQATIDAIKLFGATNHIILERSYSEYMQGFKDKETGNSCRGYIEVVKELEEKFPNPEDIITENQKIEFTKLFGEYLRIENVLQNYDEFAGLKAFQQIDKNDEKEVEDFKAKYYLSDETINLIKDVKIPSERAVQDCKSTYNDIREWLRVQKASNQKDSLTLNWNDVVFEVDLLKSQEINLDYILELIFENNRKNQNKEALVEDARRLIRSSIGNRAKESLLVDFINKTNLDEINDKAALIDEFFKYAQKEQLHEVEKLIKEENLNEEPAKRYIALSLKKEYASENGTELNSILPKMSPLNPNYLTKKHTVFQKITALVEKFKGVGGNILE